MDSNQHLFWPEKIAKEVIKKFNMDKYVVMTGTSISGDPHIGNANDVIRGYFIKVALELLGKKSELVWVADDMDPLRSVPEGLPKGLDKYLGIPVCNVPDFFGCHKTFTIHYEEKFLNQLEKLFIKPKAFFGIEMYKNGMYNETIKISMEKREEIMKILNKYRTNPLPKDWYPIDVVCENCGKISTTKILEYDNMNFSVKYICEKVEKILHKKYKVSGCDYIGTTSIFNGNCKLTWRVEWPARWSFFKVTCEPFGKEHAAAGGSWDTAKEIVKIFNWEPPYPVIYEHFLVEGQKMSKSKGNIITIDDILNFLLPEHIRYWMVQGKLTIAKDIRLASMVPHLFNEFDKAKKIYLGLETTNDKRKDNNYKKAYLFATFDIKESENVFNVSFETFLELVKVSPESNEVEFLKKRLKKLNYDFDENELEKRIKLAKNYLEKIIGNEKIEKIEIDEKTKSYLKKLINIIKDSENDDLLQQKIFEIANEYGDVKNFFSNIYKILFGKEQGPKLAKYIFIAGKENIIEKLKKFL